MSVAELLSVMQKTAGVVAVDLDFLYKTGEARDLNSRLFADIARWDEQHESILPARMLLINPKGILLTSRSSL